MLETSTETYGGILNSKTQYFKITINFNNIIFTIPYNDITVFLQIISISYKGIIIIY